MLEKKKYVGIQGLSKKEEISFPTSFLMFYTLNLMYWTRSTSVLKNFMLVGENKPEIRIQLAMYNHKLCGVYFKFLVL